jgi:hypothetical protein
MDGGELHGSLGNCRRVQALRQGNRNLNEKAACRGNPAKGAAAGASNG